MSYAPITDVEFLGKVESWFRNQHELLALIRYSHAAGMREFRLFATFQGFSEALRALPHLAWITCFVNTSFPCAESSMMYSSPDAFRAFPKARSMWSRRHCSESMGAGRGSTTIRARHTPSCVMTLRGVAALRSQRDFIRFGFTTTNT
jgi:hypothetical protein